MDKKTLVIGLGLSGLAAAEFLLSRGKRVLGVDASQTLLQTNGEAARLQSLGLECRHDSASVDWSEIEQVVVSPGVPPTHPLYKSAVEKGIRVTGEAELALPHFDKPLLAVTGTNGKTTATLLTEHILNAAGIKAKALGNVGTPLCSFLLRPEDVDVFVVELSSYQLETMRTPVFDAAVLLNITPDHLDRYPNMEEYARAKCRLQYLLKKGAKLWVQEEAAKEFGHLLSNFQTFSPDAVEIYLPIGYRMMARHDKENAFAAWALCQPFALSKEQFGAALQTFSKPPHRIEFIAEVGGVSYYDDSKGTNIDAVVQAVKAMRGPVILIAGGVDKGASYLFWKDPFFGKVKEIIAIGQAAQKMYRELHPYFNVKLAETLPSAVEMAAVGAEKGDCVLLSPGCSSFDMFRDYAHRGEEFQRQVKIIEGRRGS